MGLREDGLVFHTPFHSPGPNTFFICWHCMHAVAHARENKAETTASPPRTGEICELRPIETQVNGALTELPPDSGFVQFAYWDGDSGGDAWIYDLRYKCIRCITASVMGPHSMADVRAYSYGVFFHYDWFPSYLRGVAESAGWIRMGAMK